MSKILLKMIKLCKNFIFILMLVALGISQAYAKNLRPTILIDPGHDFKTIGTISSLGVYESDYNFRIANELKNNLERSGFIVKMTHQAGETKSLKERVDIEGYDLFISMHHDSVQADFCKFNSKKICTTYSGYGYSLWVSPLSKEYKKSLKLAKKIGTNLHDAGFIHSVHHVAMENREYLDRKAGIFSYPYLYVLRHNEKPAILIEVAVITNPIDEKNANSPLFRRAFVNEVTNGVISYFEDKDKDKARYKDSKHLRK